MYMHDWELVSVCGVVVECVWCMCVLACVCVCVCVCVCDTVCVCVYRQNIATNLLEPHLALHNMSL